MFNVVGMFRDRGGQVTDVNLTKRLYREAPERRAAKWIKYDQRLQTVVDAYEDYDMLDFLKVIGCMI